MIIVRRSAGDGATLARGSDVAAGASKPFGVFHDPEGFSIPPLKNPSGSWTEPASGRHGARLVAVGAGDHPAFGDLAFHPGADGPADLVAMLASALAPGSYLVISHLTGDFAPVQVAAATAAYNARVPVPVTARTHSKVTGLFDGLPLLAPGVVPVTE